MADTASKGEAQTGVRSQDGGGVERSKKLTDLIDDIDDQVDGERDLSVEDVMDAFGSRSFGPLIAIPGLMMVTPIGGVPGMPAIVASFVVLLAGQQLAGRDKPWLPRKLRERSVSKNKWDSTSEKIRPWAKRVDKLLRPRLGVLTNHAMERAISMIVIVLALTMFPLGFIPFTTAAPGTAILFFGLAFSARDGVAVILGLVATAASGYFVYNALS